MRGSEPEHDAKAGFVWPVPGAFEGKFSPGAYSHFPPHYQPLADDVTVTAVVFIDRAKVALIGLNFGGILFASFIGQLSS
jgi:hypothetical protein